MLNHLKSFDFDELLQPVDNVDVVSLVVDGDVAGMKPTVFRDGGLGGHRVVKITLHHLYRNKSLQQICWGFILAKVSKSKPTLGFKF